MNKFLMLIKNFHKRQRDFSFCDTAVYIDLPGARSSAGQGAITVVLALAAYQHRTLS